MRVERLPENADFLRYQNIVNPTTDIVPSHKVIEAYIRRHGRDYRYQIAPNPVPELRDRREDNTSVGRIPNAAQDVYKRQIQNIGRSVRRENDVARPKIPVAELIVPRQPVQTGEQIVFQDVYKRQASSSSNGSSSSSSR